MVCSPRVPVGHLVEVHEVPILQHMLRRKSRYSLQRPPGPAPGMRKGSLERQFREVRVLMLQLCEIDTDPLTRIRIRPDLLQEGLDGGTRARRRLAGQPGFGEEGKEAGPCDDESQGCPPDTVGKLPSRATFSILLRAALAAAYRTDPLQMPLLIFG